jgi:hypothetical protein
MTIGYSIGGYGEGRLCNCIGPQNGQPRCPCQMKNVIKRDGRWVQKEVDLGPIRTPPSTTKGE